MRAYLTARISLPFVIGILVFGITFAPYANTIATRERINDDPVLASFAANDSLSSLDAVPHRKTSPSTHAHPYFDFLPGND